MIITIMNTLDVNIFTDCICPHLTGKIIDDILLVNKHYNVVVKADMKHLYNLFWTVEKGNIPMSGDNGKYEMIYKDGKQEGEELYWYENGQLFSKTFYKEGKQDGDELGWYPEGQLYFKIFYNAGNREGEQLAWYENGQLMYKEFYKEGKQEGEQLQWLENGQLQLKKNYNEGKFIDSVKYN